MKICWCVWESNYSIYNISWFFHNIQYFYGNDVLVHIRYKGGKHGNYIIDIINNKSIWRKVDDSIDLFLGLPKCDVFIYSGHCAPLWIKTEKSRYHMKSIFSVIKPKLLIYDCCYMGFIKTVQALRNSADYLICCSSASPNVGFVGPKLLHFLSSKRDIESIGKDIIKDFIKRCNNISPKLQYRSNALLLNLRYSDIIANKLDLIQSYYEDNYKKIKLIKIENNRNYYGVWIDNFIKDKKEVNELVIYHKKNNKLKTYLGKNDKKIKIGLGVIYE